MMYGMGPNLLSENMGVSLDEANKIIKDFHEGFPQVSEWMRQTEEEASKTGYVEDFWGRRRRLPDLLLPEYSFAFKDNNTFNPLLGSSGKYENTALLDKYQTKLNNMKMFNEYEKIKKEADKEGLLITKNGGFISRAKRQCVNARIQGSASSMTKIAMIAIENDPIMKEIDFRLLIGVHDELIGECPEEFAEIGSERLTYLMKTCVPELDVPLKCDPTVERHWYEEEYQKQIKNEYEKGKSFDEICADHSESTREQIAEYLK